MELLTQVAPKLLDYGALGITCLFLISAIFVIGKLYLSSQKENKQLHQKLYDEQKAWSAEKLEFIKQMIEADHASVSTTQSMVTALGALKSSQDDTKTLVSAIVRKSR